MWEGKRPVDDYNFYSLLGIVQSGMWLQRDLELYLRSFDLTFGRFSILLSILDTPDNAINGKELCRKIGVTKTTISKMVKKLIQDDLIRPSSPPGDRRVVEYRITEAGTGKLNDIIPGYLLRMRLIGSNISIAEKKSLISIVGKINFIDKETVLSRFEERPIADKAEEIKRYCGDGTPEDIDSVMRFLDETADIPITRIVDYYLGTVKTIEGMKRIEYYLFNGTQMQRNYATLFFARKNEWALVNKAYGLGLIDYIQAYSK
ncbi:MAG: hypothetical protein CVV47_08395 [Spirochaetae bacterium HGW-Spirochaetae-3]|jgi:DNA-binding MarR family transcriptional regulator|nr:MAG: hypothetical protein CVV47_08395 [Spirochaetae bacterium HGW-Spirochaetae-3]